MFFLQGPGLMPHWSGWWSWGSRTDTDQIRSDQSLSRVRLFATPWIIARQAPCPSPTPRVHSDSRPSSQWCHPAISSSVFPFSSCPQSLPASGSFPMNHLLAWGGQSIGVWASASVPPMSTQDWSPLGWTGWISLQSKGLSRVFSNITVQKQSVRMGIIKKSTNNKCWKGCGEKGMLLHCWWEYRLIQSLWKMAWIFLKKLGINPLYDSAISLLSIYL